MQAVSNCAWHSFSLRQISPVISPYRASLRLRPRMQTQPPGGDQTYSRETLRIDLSKADVSRDLAECHPAQIKALVHLHSRRAAAALAIISDASIEGLTCPGEYCEDGVAEWWLEVIKRSRTELRARPTTDILFSPAFLAACCRVASKRCRTCPDQYLSSRAQHKLGYIKDAIDALPSSL